MGKSDATPHPQQPFNSLVLCMHARQRVWRNSLRDPGFKTTLVEEGLYRARVLLTHGNNNFSCLHRHVISNRQDGIGLFIL